MATTSYGVNDPLAVKLWQRTLNHEVKKATWLEKFMGSSDASIIQVKDQTSKSAGDKVTYGLRMQMTGDGILGDATLEGNEEALVTYNDAVFIDQLRHATRSKGKMSEQRVPFSVREEGKTALADWWSSRIDESGFNQLCGYTPQTDVRHTGLQAVVAPDSDHIIRTVSTEAADESISTTSLFTLSFLDKAIERAATLTPAIKPVKIGGKPMYVVFIHPYQKTAMRTTTSTGQWLDIQKAAMMGGEVGDNPIFDGSLGVYNGCILHEDTRVTQGVAGAGTPVTAVRRAVFLGAQAAAVAYGRDSSSEKFSWVEELFDFKNQLGVSAGMIWGMKKSVFDSKDFASIVLASYAVQS